MAVRDSFSAVSDGDQLNDGYFNENYYGSKTHQIYTGDGFDVTRNTNGSDTDDHELDSISATNLQGSDYIEITMLVYSAQFCSKDGADAATATNYLKIESKAIGGSYSDSMTTKTISLLTPSNNTQHTSNNTIVIKWIHTLTTTEKSDGVQFKITATATASISASSSVATSLTNLQTVVKGVY